jgi:hypothetical protein
MDHKYTEKIKIVLQNELMIGPKRPIEKKW